MKTVLIVFLSFISTCILHVKSQESNKENVTINVKSQYKADEEFAFQIKNNSSYTCKYYVGLEAFFNDTWHEVVTDIDPSAPKMGAVEKTLLPKRSKNVVYGPLNYFAANNDPRITKADMINIKGYRLVLNYRYKNSSNDLHLYSKEFTVK